MKIPGIDPLQDGKNDFEKRRITIGEFGDRYPQKPVLGENPRQTPENIGGPTGESGFQIVYQLDVVMC